MKVISAEEVVRMLVTEGQENSAKYGFKLGDTIKFTPSQVGEILQKMEECIIRCENCKYYEEREEGCDSPANIEGIWVYLVATKDGFCSWGKKKDEVKTDVL